MTILPPELILHIIKLSVTAESNINFTNHNQSKTRTLVTFCKVSTTFRIFATQILWNEIVITAENVSLFLKGFNARKEHSGGKIPKVKKIRFEFIKGSEGVDLVLGACKSTLTHITCMLVENITLDGLAIVTHLESLAFSNCSILPSSNLTSFKLLHLRHISLNFVSIPLHQFNPNSLPSLQAIALDEMPNFGTIDCPNTFINRFARQLNGLALGILTRYDSNAEEIEWNSMKELKVLSFAASTEWILYPSRRYETGEGGVVRDFLHQLEETKLVALHYPYLRDIGFEPLINSTSKLSCYSPTCLEHLEMVVFSLPEVIYSSSKILTVEKYGVAEIESIRSAVVGDAGVVVEWEGEKTNKGMIDRRLYTSFWGLMEDLDYGRIGRRSNLDLY